MTRRDRREDFKNCWSAPGTPVAAKFARKSVAHICVDRRTGYQVPIPENCNGHPLSPNNAVYELREIIPAHPTSSYDWVTHGACIVYATAPKETGHTKTWAPFAYDRPTHVWMWEHCHGRKLPKGWCVHHICANPQCINPMHLWAMANSEHTALHHRLQKEHTTPVHQWLTQYERPRSDFESAADLRDTYGFGYCLGKGDHWGRLKDSEEAACEMARLPKYRHPAGRAHGWPTDGGPCPTCHRAAMKRSRTRGKLISALPSLLGLGPLGFRLLGNVKLKTRHWERRPPRISKARMTAEKRERIRLGQKAYWAELRKNPVGFAARRAIHAAARQASLKWKKSLGPE